jgi:hypothetical protein
MTRFRALATLAAAALLVAGCGGGMTPHGLDAAPPNVSLVGSPNSTNIGPVDPKVAKVRVKLGSRAVIAAFRASGCDQPAPEFARTMRDQAADGLRVPDGVTIYDAGVGTYRSSRCKGQVPARAIGVYGNKPGTYTLDFFGGKTRRTVIVE